MREGGELSLKSNNPGGKMNANKEGTITPFFRVCWLTYSR